MQAFVTDSAECLPFCAGRRFLASWLMRNVATGWCGRSDAPVAERCAVIDAEKANYKIAWMCRLLGVPRSSFYAWRNRVESATAARRRELTIHVRRVFEEGRGAYGCRRVAARLNRDGHPCSVGLVADLMRELGLQAC